MHPQVMMLSIQAYHLLSISKLSRKATRGNGGQLAIGSSGKAPKKQIFKALASVSAFSIDKWLKG